jgi:outer membrane protein TolC
MIKTASENLEIAMAQYKAGTGSMLELTSARTDRLDATQKNIRAYFAYQSALINLERLTENTNQYQY